jgi:hypothetical protein
MTKPMITIHNSQTGEIITREMNAQELAQIAADDAAAQERAEAEAAKAAAKAALLAKLGISEAEAKLLLS